MILRATEIAGVTILETRKAVDERGFFARTFEARVLSEAGFVDSFGEHSIAYNETAGTLRGMHYQIGGAIEAKVVRCTRGAAFDVVVDLRKSSGTFGRWIAIALKGDDYRSVYVPPGCAHGYQTLEDGTELSYLISAPYDPESARGVNYADPRLSIEWPLPVGRISQRDRELPFLDRAELPIVVERRDGR